MRVTTASCWRETHFDGLVLGGGSDIAPGNYGDELRAAGEVVTQRRITGKFWSLLQLITRFLLSVKARPLWWDDTRDSMEREMCLRAIDQQLPVMGICRGAQLINVVLGGTLHQDIRSFYTETPRVRTIFPRKRIRLADGSRLRQVLGVAECAVNALHSQSVDRLGSGLAIVAREDNGLVQAIEHARHPFLLGVQWHPEYLPQSRTQQRLFQALTVACRRRTGKDDS